MTEPAPNVSASSAGQRVLVIEDHQLVARSLVMALRGEGVDAEAATGSSAQAVIEEAAAMCPDVVLLDLDLGPMGSGLDLITALLSLDTKVVMLSGATDRCRLAECLERGAVGIVNKAEPFERVLDAVVNAVGPGPAMSVGLRHAYLADLRAQRAERAARLKPFEDLTPREEEVLIALGDGFTAAEIAERGYVSVFTVRGHIRAVLMKLGVTSQLAAVATAKRAGWLP